MSDWLYVIGSIAMMLIVLVVVVFTFAVVLWIIAAAIFVVVVNWAFGKHFEIAENDNPVGYIKWFTYYPYTK